MENKKKRETGEEVEEMRKWSRTISIMFLVKNRSCLWKFAYADELNLKKEQTSYSDLLDA